MALGDALQNYGNIALTILGSILLRWAIAVGSYSGYNKPPMHGDFEAQRHWMEITVNLPISDWYVQTEKNDLQYWGLDYPPLTAYHSWAMGKVAQNINETWVALNSSRGIETYHHKLFMRYTVIIADILIYIPAALIYVFHMQKSRAGVSPKCIFLVTHLFYPGLVLIDHGHFQYNCVSLGFFLWAVIFVLGGYDLLGSTFFVLALNYKQMELYHALPFFCYLLGTALKLDGLMSKLKKLIMLAIIVVGTFAAIWYPFLADKNLLIQVLERLFPFDRGIFEDKVANIWCSTSVILKWKSLLAKEQMIRLCTASTLIAVLPSSVLLLWRPSKQQFKLALVNSSLAFFLFSYQVHEKSILIAAIPALLLLNEEMVAVPWFLMISCLSLHPLMVKDGLALSFFAVTVFYYVWLCDLCSLGNIVVWTKKQGRKIKHQALLFNGSVILGFCLCAASHILKPPKKLPDVFPMLNAVYSCLHFTVFLLYCNWKQFLSWRSYNAKNKRE